MLNSFGHLNLTRREEVPEATKVHTLMYKTHICNQQRGILSLLAGSGTLTVSGLSADVGNWVGCGSNGIRSLNRAPILSLFLNC